MAKRLQPRSGTKAERIVAILKQYPTMSYAKISRIAFKRREYVHLTRQEVATTAALYGLTRGNRAIPENDVEKIVELVKTTTLPYSVIAEMAGGYGRETVRMIVKRFGLHNPNIRNPSTAAAYARKKKKEYRTATFNYSPQRNRA